MAGRIDDLEHNINDLMVQAGQGETNQALTTEHQKWNSFSYLSFSLNNNAFISVWMCIVCIIT